MSAYRRKDRVRKTRCIMHLKKEVKDDIKRFTEKSWLKYIECAREWVLYDCPGGKLALQEAGKMGILLADDDIRVIAYQPNQLERGGAFPAPIPAHVGFHKKCYSKFCDVQNLGRKRRKTEKEAARKAKEAEEEGNIEDLVVKFEIATDNQDAETTEQEAADESGIPTKKVRVSSPISNKDKQQDDVVPNIVDACAICRAIKYIRKKSSGSRSLERLTSATTPGACSKLLQTAKAHGRHDIITFLGGDDVDLLALGVKYHATCYRTLTRDRRPVPNPNPTPYRKSFDQFCQTYVQPRLLEGKAILTLSKLRRAFVRTVRRVEGLKIHGYKSHYLKKRLKSRFPQLVFQSCPARSDRVYSEELEAEDINEQDVEDDTSDTDGTSTDGEMDGMDGQKEEAGNDDDDSDDDTPVAQFQSHQSSSKVKIEIKNEQSNYIQQRLAFCDGCGHLRLRDVADRLQELFIQRSINPDVCGICNRSIKEGSTDDTSQGKHTTGEEGKHTTEEHGTEAKKMTGNSHTPGLDLECVNEDDEEWQDIKMVQGTAVSLGDEDDDSDDSEAGPCDKETDESTDVSLEGNVETIKANHKLAESNPASTSTHTPSSASGRPTRLRTGALNVTDYKALLVGTKSSDVDEDDEDEEDTAMETDDDACDADYDPGKVKDDKDAGKDIHVSQYIVRKKVVLGADDAIGENITYNCIHENCNFTFDRKDKLVSHIQVHKGVRKLLCKECGMGYFKARQLSRHLLIKHGKQSYVYSCQMCEKSFSQHSVVKDHHVKEHNPNRRQKNPDMYKLKCAYCSFTCGKISEMRRHQMQRHFKMHTSLVCEHCKRSFSSKTVLTNHVESKVCRHSKDTTNSYQKKVLEATRYLHGQVLDMMEISENSYKPFKCKNCWMYKFKQVVEFLQHQKEEHGDLYPDIDTTLKAAFQCQECDQVFPSQELVESHVMSSHGMDGIYKCSHRGCHETFMSKLVRSSHKKAHIGKCKKTVTLHSCVHCEEAFPTKTSLMQHLKDDHHITKPFVCNDCGLKFRRKNHHDNHQDAVHRKLKPHLCPDCGQAFAGQGTFVNHMRRIHGKMNPSVCEQCGKQFGNNNELKKHMLYHTGEKPYKCDSCDYQCVRADYLRKHKAARHAGNQK